MLNTSFIAFIIIGLIMQNSNQYLKILRVYVSSFYTLFGVLSYDWFSFSLIAWLSNMSGVIFIGELNDRLDKLE